MTTELDPGELDSVLGRVEHHSWDQHGAPLCHARPYSQRLEALLQSCQVVCTLLQGAIDTVKAMPQPMETGVSVSFSLLPNVSCLPPFRPCSLLPAAFHHRKLMSCYSRRRS